MEGSESKAAANCCCLYCRCYCIRRTAGSVQLIKQEILCFYTESSSGNYSGNNLIVGVVDKNYILKVSTGGQTYMANSILSVKIAFDSLTYKDDDPGNTKHIKELTVHLKDPVGVRNQYRFVVTVNGQQVKRIFAYNDDFTDGAVTYTRKLCRMTGTY